MKFLNKKLVILILVGGILILGFTLRFLVFKSKIQDFNLVGDAKNYTFMSRQIIDDHVYGYSLGKKSVISNAYVTPGYPIFLAVVYAFFRDIYLHISMVRLIQVIIGGIISPLLAYLFIRRLLRKESVAILTAFFVAIYPTYILSATYILTEVLSLATMLLYLYLITAALQDKKPYLSILSGTAFALNIFVRPTMFPLFIIPFVFAYFTWLRNDRKLLFRLFTFNLAALILIMVPWWIRNYFTMHRFILLATGSEDPLLAGTYPYMKGLFEDYLSEKVRVTEGAYAKKRIIKGFTQEPLLYLKWYTIGKLQCIFTEPWLLSNTRNGFLFHLTDSNSMKIIHNIFVYAGLVGVLVNSAVKKVNAFINLYALMYLGLILVFIPVNRYAYHHMFFFMVSTAILVCLLAEYLVKAVGIKVFAETDTE